MVQKSCRGARSLDRVGQYMTRIGSGLDWINVLTENRYLDRLGHGLKVSELWCNSDGYSTISRHVIRDLGKFNAPLPCGFDVGLEVHKYERGSDPSYLTQPQTVLGKTSTCA